MIHRFGNVSVNWYGRFVAIPWGCRVETGYYLSWLRLRVFVRTKLREMAA